VDHELAARREQAARAVEQAKQEVLTVRQALVDRRAQVAVAQSDIERAGKETPAGEVKPVGVLGALPALELREDGVEKREAALALGASLERRGISLLFQVVDDASLPSGDEAKERQVLLGFVWLACGLPFVVMAVGAFLPRKGFR